MASAIDLTGNRYGNLLVVSLSNERSRRYAMWECQCDCGNKRLVQSSRLLNGGAKSCGCLRGRPNGVRPTLSGLLSHDFWSSFIHAVEHRRKKELDIDAAYAEELLVKQEFKCAISGVPITIPPHSINHHNNRKFYTASIDRIDSSKGYVRGNIQWLHKTVNVMKNNMTDEEFVEWCRIIAAHNLGSNLVQAV